MKKSIALFLTIILATALILSGCSNNKTSPVINSTNPPITTTIVTSFYPMYIETINITKDVPNVAVVNMTKPQTGCLHDYQLIPDDLKTLEAAQIFIVNGADMETFLNKTISQFPKLKIVEASRGIELLKGTTETTYNPHIWVSISLCIEQVKNISNQLSAIDPANSAIYKRNADEYIKKLEIERAKMHSALDNIKNKNIITFHEAFPYFAKEFNLNIVAVIEREPGSEPSAGELAKTIEIVKATNIKALFAEPQYSAKAADTIAAETGSKVYSLDPGVSGPYNADAYINIMENNLKVLEEALK